MSPDSGLDADSPPSDVGVDAAEDVGVDARQPDAWAAPELVFQAFDTSPCPRLDLRPPRARQLPADPTPRLLWSRTLAELGVEGEFIDGALGSDGHIHVSTVLFSHRHFEIDGGGALLGVGRSLAISKEPRGPMGGLVDGRVAEWATGGLRIDHTPPRPDSAQYALFEEGERGVFDGVDVASTSDGFYAYRSSRQALRKFCADGRAQWELRGFQYAPYLQVESDDSVWLHASPATDSQVVRVSAAGALVERVPWPEDVGHDGMGVLFAGDTRFVNARSLDARSSIVVAVDEESGAELHRIAVPFDDLYAFRPDPTGAIWVMERHDARLTRYVNGVAVARTPAGLPIVLDDSILLGDGSLVALSFTAESAIVVHVMSDGLVAWTLPYTGSSNRMLLDVDGRLYVLGSSVHVLQTDVLPPTTRGCWQPRCSAQADRRIAALEE
ncbi:MAG: hypothetical protein J0L92_39670 [Deltaproteobacteria bacterium]|nr:hypothetical protein [Deltaproteobacteria bacterium]